MGVIRQAEATTSAEELRAWANARLGKHQRVSGVEFCDSFPRNALGKVIKRELRDLERSRTQAQTADATQVNQCGTPSNPDV